jgi:hypothetical protein
MKKECIDLINEMALESYPSETEKKLKIAYDLFNGKITLSDKKAWELLNDLALTTPK